MARPAVTPFTERLYARLPEYLRIADAQESSGGGYPLLRYLSGASDEAGKIAEMLERIDYLPPGDRPPAPALRTIIGDLDDLVPTGAASIVGTAPNGPYWRLDASGESVTHTAYLNSGRWRVDVRGATGPAQGVGAVTLDGEPMGEFDAYSSATQASATLLSYEAEMTLGYHTVDIAFTGRRNAASTAADLSLLGVTLTQITSTGDDTSDLVDPWAADPAWLPWLARLVGVNLVASLTVPEQRDAVAYATSGFRAGTKEAIAAAARSALTGTKHVEVYDHSISAPGNGGPWDILLVTRGTETPNVNTVLRAVTTKNAKPAGVVLHHRAYDTAWDTVEANYPTWQAVEAAGSWNAIQEAGL